MRRVLWALFAVLLLGAFAGPAFAGIREGAITLSPMVGQYVFEGDQDLEDRLAYQLGLGYHFTPAFAVEGLAGYVETDLEADSSEDVRTVLYRLDGLYHFMPDRDFVPYLAAGLGGITANPDTGNTDTDFLLNYGLGLKYFLADDMALRGDVRHIYAFGDPENNLVYSAGLTFLFGGEKKKPQPPRDSDGDGVYDDQDRCPDTPLGVKVDRNGCPLDSDGDGVPDYLDKCPDTPKGVKVDAKGCPLDSDGDGVPDYLDQCPDTPKGAPVDKVGCPLDSDGDGVPDYLDQCPGTPKGIMVDEKGCPLTFTLHIEFDFDKADIRPEYHGQLSDAAAFINRYPEAPLILIAGHTDAMGTDEYNKELSQRRAESVRAYLIANFGLPADKLVPKGYGESQPVADNDTDEGRQKNRRVEVTCCAIIPE